MGVRSLSVFGVWLAILAAPAGATITYTYCSSGCNSTGGDYTSVQSAPGATGLGFSSPITFLSGGLNGSGVYTDPATGAIFTGYGSGGVSTSPLSVSGTSLNLGTTGSGAGIEITLPSNTYAFAMMLSVASGSTFNAQAVEVGDRNIMASNYSIWVSSVGSGVFFAIVSDTPLTSLYFGNTSNFQGAPQIQSFATGQPAEAPEGATGLLLGGGLTGLVVLRRRRQAKLLTA